MSRSLLLYLALFLLVIFSAAQAADLSRIARGEGDMHTGAPADAAKAPGDTILLMGPTGSGAPYIGDFESGWAGWTSIDYTLPTVTHWSVSDKNWQVFGQDPANLAAWCGEDLPACTAADSAWGYGNNSYDLLAWRAAVLDPGATSTVHITGTMVLDTEPGYDYLHLSTRGPDEAFTDYQSWDGGNSTLVLIDKTLVIPPQELRDGTDVEILFRFVSDGGWSDQDCMSPSAGACQIDDLSVTVTNGAQVIATFDDFQGGGFDHWQPVFPHGVGDFAALWTGLDDLDPCAQNFSTQVAFIDDGVVEPGTGGSHCINWCYGPGGHIVNPNGGLAGPDAYLHNGIESPIMAWPNPAYEGITLAFDVYHHEDLSPDAPGMFFQWGIRSTSGTDPQDIPDESWQDRAFVYAGEGYYRKVYPVADLMEPAPTFVQVQLAVYELGWAWGWYGIDGYPAPYFDNVSVRIYPIDGPDMYAREIDLANDGFPQSGTIDTSDLGSHSVRFDMARNIAPASHLRNDPGDSLVVDIGAVRLNSTLTGMPTLEWRLRPNTLFDPYRTSPLGTATLGSVPGWVALGPGGVPVQGRYAFDLPDTGFLFPGDVLHYFIRAQDDVASDVRTSILPPDTTGFSRFDHPLAYDFSFTARALPTLWQAGFGGYETPDILFWNDDGNRGGQDEWYGALDQLGLRAGIDYDIYDTSSPSSGVGNGLGGRATPATLADYDVILYTCGDLRTPTISNGDYLKDAGDDVGVLADWLAMGDKGMFATGDNLVNDLSGSGATTLAFAQDNLGVSLVGGDLRPLIGDQTSPRAVPLEGKGVITGTDSWLVYGGCPSLNAFDAVTPLPQAVPLAEFLDPAGLPGAYPYSALTTNTYLGSKVVSAPYDLMFIHNDPSAAKASAPLPARAVILKEVLRHLGLDMAVYYPVDVPTQQAFTASHHPNPFNPVTEIAFTLPQTGQVTIKVFTVRGELVATLLDEQRPEGPGKITWGGADNRGAAVASGVYFYQVRSGGEVKIGKMALIR